MLQTSLAWVVVTVLYGVLGKGVLAMIYLPHSRPDWAADKAELTLWWFEAIWAFTLESSAIETAKAEKISTNIIDRISATPLRLGFDEFVTGFIFPPLRKDR
jgi:hypothetical protein